MNRSLLRWVIVIVCSPAALLVISLMALAACLLVFFVGLRSYASLTIPPDPVRGP